MDSEEDSKREALVMLVPQPWVLEALSEGTKFIPQQVRSWLSYWSFPSLSHVIA